MESKLRRPALAVLALAAGTFLAMLFVGPIAQSQAYHRFADARTLLGVPNAWNVLSNAPFLVVGLLGLAFLASPPSERTFAARWEKGPWALFFVGS